MKKYIGLAIAIAVFTIYIALYNMMLEVPSVHTFDVNKPLSRLYMSKEEALMSFLEKRLMGPKGEIYTNIKYSGKKADTLSESIGLMMNYCVLRDKKELLDKEEAFLRESLLTDKYYVRWRAPGDSVSCNALIDDLRIIRALMDAYEKWGQKSYLNTAGFMQNAIFEKQTGDEGVYELYDWKTNSSKRAIPLCYLDLYTMDRIMGFNKSWAIMWDRGLDIIKRGRISESSPFYYKYFDYKTQSYSLDEEYEKSGGVCLTYTLYTVLHLVEMNEDTSDFTQWLKKEMEKGKLYAWYDPKTLKPANSIESTAVYALSAVYSKMAGENELYHKLMGRMLGFMIANPASKNYGGFGNEQTGEFYSFDNLTALWALSQAD